MVILGTGECSAAMAVFVANIEPAKAREAAMAIGVLARDNRDVVCMVFLSKLP